MTNEHHEQEAGVSHCYLAVARAADALLGGYQQGTGGHRDLARVLGPHHPEGERECIDPRLVRRWSSGERAVPAWVPDTLARLLREHASAMLAAAAELEHSMTVAPQETKAVEHAPPAAPKPAVARSTVDGSALREAGRAIGNYMSADTVRCLGELERMAASSPGRVFKGTAEDLGREIVRRVRDDMHSCSAPNSDVAAVNRAFYAMGKSTKGPDLAPLFEGVWEVRT